MKKIKISYNFKNNKGITLIALIITIIILLILSGVTIGVILSNENTIDKAKKTSDNTNIQAAKEQTLILVTNYITDYKNKGMTFDNEGEYIASELSSIKQSGNYYIKVTKESDGTRTIDVSNDSSQNNIVISGQVDDDGQIVWNTSVSIPKDLKVGSEIEYIPSKSAEWDARYASTYREGTSSFNNIDKTGDKKIKSGLKQDGTLEDFGIKDWKVWDIDKTTGTVRLVPASATTGQLTLQGAQGYNNVVYLLDKVCNDLYGDSSKGITARSIDFKDIEDAMKKVHNVDDIDDIVVDGVEIIKNSKSSSYMKQQSSEYTVANSNYPVIYAYEENAVINPTPSITINKLLGHSDSIGRIERNQDGATNGKVMSESTRIRPYRTFYSIIESDIRKIFKDTDYINLLIPTEGVKTYWLASRSVIVFSSYCDFYVYYMTNGATSATLLDYSKNSNGASSQSLFPVLELDGSLIKKVSDNKYEIN